MIRVPGLTVADQPNLSADVLVIGGGPGGSTAAAMLARKGWRVLLLEREFFPRHHVGESLLPASLPVLEELGVLPDVEAAGFLPKLGATMVWGRHDKPWSWYFRETNPNRPHAYQVWRPLFDQLLLDNSRALGVEVHEGHQVVDVLLEDRRVAGVRYQSAAGQDGTARARFVVDATGQGALLGRRLGLRRWDPFFRNMAVYGYVTGADRLPAPDETNIFIEAQPHGWSWTIPLHTGWTSVGTVMDSRHGQERLSKGKLQEAFLQQVAQAPHTARLLRDATLVSGPQVVRDWSYNSERLVGDGYILVGDAACFVDPLFSSGVHLALMSGVLAAAYVSTVLKDPDMAAAAGQVYTELYQKEYGHFRTMAQLFYASNRTAESYFWEARRLLGDQEEVSPRQAFIHAVAGQSPRGYERVVLERGETPEAFTRDVRTLESARARRRERLQAGGTPEAMQAAVPHLPAGVAVKRKPVLGAGEFVWGDVLITDGYPEGMPCSPLAAQVVSLIDGRTTVGEILDRVCAGRDASQCAAIVPAVLQTLRILHVDGTVTGLFDTVE